MILRTITQKSEYAKPPERLGFSESSIESKIDGIPESAFILNKYGEEKKIPKYKDEAETTKVVNELYMRVIRTTTIKLDI